MKLYIYAVFFALLIGAASGCKKDHFNDTSFVSGASSVTGTAAMFTITQDNTGLVTITPGGSGAVSYDVVFGDSTKSAAPVAPGHSVNHIYAEGSYQVKITGHDLKGGTFTNTQPLTVSYITPQDLKATVNITNLTVSVSATAKYATFYKIYYGDSANSNPVPYTQTLAGKTVTHTYLNAGTYIVKVVALSGGSETAEFLDTIHVARQISLPVSFEDPNTDYTLSDFGGNASLVTTDPTDNTNHVMRSTKTGGAQTWAGTTIGTGLGFASPIPLTAAFAKMSVRIYSPAAGLDIRLKVEDHNNGAHSVETDVLTTKSNQWETLTFDFSQPATGTPAFNASYTYDKASLFFDFGNPGSGSVFYADSLQSLVAPLTRINLPVTFESSTVDYTVTDFGGNASALTTDPVNSSNHVILSTKTNGAQTWAGTTIGGPNGFAAPIPLSTSRTKMTVKIYSPAAGIPILLKLEDHTNGGISVQVQVNTTLANQWETLTFDFGQPGAGSWSSSNTYDKASIFFDFGNAGSGKQFYWDDIYFL